MSHPEVHIPPETFVLGDCIEAYKRFRSKRWKDLVYLVMAQFEFHHEFYTFDLRLRPLVKRLLHAPEGKRNLAFILDSFYRYHAERRGRSIQRWGDKTPLYSLEAEVLEQVLQVFPDAQFVHIVRDGYDTVYSTVRYGFYTDVVPAAKLWVKVVEKLRRFTAAHSSQCFSIRYEDLVGEPERTVRSICGFLNVSFEPGMLTSQDVAKEMGDVPFFRHHKEVTQPVNTANVGKGRGSLSQEEISLLQPIIGDQLEMLGYPR